MSSRIELSGGRFSRDAVVVACAVGVTAVFALVLTGTSAISAVQALTVACGILGVALVVRYPSLVVHALIVLLFTAAPSDLTYGVRVGGFFIFFYEVFLFASLVYVAVVYAQWNQRISSPILLLGALFGCVVVYAAVLGLHHGFTLADIQNDARPVAEMLVAAVIAMVLFATGRSSEYANTVLGVLVFSAVATVYSSISGTPLGARTETAELSTDTGDVVGGGSEAARYLTEAVPLALVVLIVGTTYWLYSGQLSRKLGVALAAALIISLLAFSRNTWLALGCGVVMVLVFGVVTRRFVDVFRRLIGACCVVAFAAAAAWAFSAVFGFQGWWDTQVMGFTNRVVSGFNSSAASVDSSAQYRLSENRYLMASIKGHPYEGGGFGLRYRPAVGEVGDFTADRGQLYAHNTYLWLFAKGGAAGIGSFVLLLLAPCALALGRRCEDARVVAAVSTLLALGVTMIFVPIPLDYYDSTIVGVVLGACVGLTATRFDRVDAPASDDSRTNARQLAEFTD